MCMVVVLAINMGCSHILSDCRKFTPYIFMFTLVVLAIKISVSHLADEAWPSRWHSSVVSRIYPSLVSNIWKQPKSANVTKNKSQNKKN